MLAAFGFALTARTMFGFVQFQVQLRQIPQALQIKHRQKFWRRDKGVRRPWPRRTRTVGDELLISKPREEIATDLLSEYVGKTSAIDGLVIGDGAKHGHFGLGEADLLLADIGGRLDRFGEMRLGPKHPAACDLNQLVGAC